MDTDFNELERFERYYVKSQTGAIRFNTTGRARLAPWFARHGFSLQNCTTESELRARLRVMLARELEEAREAMRAMLKPADCAMTLAERNAVESLLRHWEERNTEPGRS